MQAFFQVKAASLGIIKPGGGGAALPGFGWMLGKCCEPGISMFTPYLFDDFQIRSPLPPA